MKSFKLFAAAALLALIPSFASAQGRIVIRSEIVEIETDDSRGTLEVFSVDREGLTRYWVSLGHIGMGTHVVQVNIDPVSEILIPLGDTLEEAQATMETIFGYYSEPLKSERSIDGVLGFVNPKDEYEPIGIITGKRIITRWLEFYVQREGYVLSTYVDKSDFKSLVNGIKFYRKIHPKQQ